MIGKFFSGLSKIAKIIFISGFTLALLLCLLLFSYCGRNDSTNKHDAQSVESQAKAQVEIERIRAVEGKGTLDVTEAMRLEYELKGKQTKDVNLEMQLDKTIEMQKIQADAEKKKADAAAKAAAQKAAIQAKRAKEKEEMDILKSLASD